MRTSLLAILALSSLAAAACSSTSDTPSPDRPSPLLSNEVTLLDFEFDGELIASDGDAAKRKVTAQLFYLVGVLNPDNANARISFAELSRTETSPAGDLTLLKYHAKIPVAWPKNKTIPADHHQKARAHLAGHWAAGMDVQAGTGWHITEVKRFAEGGAIEAHPNGDVEGVAGVLVCPEAKGGGELRTPVSATVLAAARLLLLRGGFDVARYRNAVKAACVAAGVPVFTPGRFRHTVGTAAINSGANAAQVSAFLNHKDPRTLKRFYATHAVVAKIPTLL